MKFGIFGDIHGNLEALEAVLQDMQTEGVTHTVCVGDLVGQYANPRECLEIVQALGSPLVKGNNDEQARSPLTGEQRQFLQALPLQRTVDSFTVVHSSLDRPDRWTYVFSPTEAELSFQHQTTDLCFFGHTHLPSVFIRDTEVHGFLYKKLEILPGKKYLVNVGSVGESRDGDWRAAYAIYDTSRKTVELRRLPFDFKKAQAKIRGTGLF